MLPHPFIKSAPEQMHDVSQGQLPWVVSPTKTRKQLPKIRSAADLIVSNLQLPPELISGVLHQGLKGVLASSSKAGKTWLLLDMALSVASGLPWMKFDTTKAKVLVVNFEIPEVFLRERISQLNVKKAEFGHCDLGNLHLWTLRGFNSGFSELLLEISNTIRNEKYGLVIIDPIYKGLAGADENKAGDVATLCNQFEALCVETGAALMYAHHFSKGNKASANPLDRMSGSGVFARDADTIILLTDHEEPDCYTVELILRNLPRAEPFVVQWEFPLMVLREDLAAEDLAGKPGRKAEYDADDLLNILAGPMTHKAWLAKAMSELDMSRATFNRLLGELKNEQKVEQPAGTKKWQPVAKAVSQPNTDPSAE